MISAAWGKRRGLGRRRGWKLQALDGDAGVLPAGAFLGLDVRDTDERVGERDGLAAQVVGMGAQSFIGSRIKGFVRIADRLDASKPQRECRLVLPEGNVVVRVAWIFSTRAC